MEEHLRLMNAVTEVSQSFNVSKEEIIERLRRKLNENANMPTALTINVPHWISMANLPPLPPNSIGSVAHIPHISLANSELFQMFHQNENEMYVLNQGRVLLPSPEYAVSNLVPHKTYTFGIKLRHFDKCFMTYKNDRWVSTRRSTLIHEDTNEVFSNEIVTGIAQCGVKFEKLKISNDVNAADTRKMIKVLPMAKYIPILTAYEVTDDRVCQPIAQYSFEETKFVVVTQFRNPEIAKLKNQKITLRSVCKQTASGADGDAEGQKTSV